MKILRYKRQFSDLLYANHDNSWWMEGWEHNGVLNRRVWSVCKEPDHSKYSLGIEDVTYSYAGHFPFVSRDVGDSEKIRMVELYKAF